MEAEMDRGTSCWTTAVARLGGGPTSCWRWVISATLVKWVMCKTSIPGKGLLEKQGLRKIFLGSERSKVFCCHFLHFTPNLNCPEGLKCEYKHFRSLSDY